MALGPKPTLADLEALIGIKPWREDRAEQYTTWTEVANSPGKLAYARQWLVLQGIPNILKSNPGSSASMAKAEQVGKAYAIRNYLRTWRKNANPDWGLLGETDADDGTGEAFNPNPSPAAPSTPLRSVSEQTLVKQADASDTKKFLEDLFKQIDGAVKKLVPEEVAKIRLTAELSANAKQEIATIAAKATEAKIKELMPPREILITNSTTGTSINVGIQHFKFPRLLKALRAKANGQHLNIWLTGPTGSGKTTAVKKAAKALDLEFEAEGSLDADFKLLGYMDAQGRYVETAFFRRYTKGGIILLDEIDNYSPSAILGINAATANDFCQFPCGLYERHPDCIIVACANTWGLGANMHYVGRSRLDAATLDRFQPKIAWDYDEKLEMTLAIEQGGDVGRKWCEIVQKTRKNVFDQGLQIIISPRATYYGLGLLLSDSTLEEVVDETIAAGISPEQRKAIGLGAAAQSGPSASLNNTVKFLLKQGKKIEAIKLYRENTGCDLYEAKTAIEELEYDAGAAA